jgi:alpha-D-ribose 1-methylphosphonate 5-phosphate C-P lyase
VQISRDVEQRQLRAYAFVEGGGVENFTASTKAEIKITLKNTEQTPAYHVKIHLGADVRRYPRSADTYAPIIADLMLGELVVNPGPGNIYTLTTPVPYNQATIDLVTSGNEYRLYVVGYITYVDAFDKAHRSGFCHMYFGPRLTPDKAAYCETYSPED